MSQHVQQAENAPAANDTTAEPKPFDYGGVAALYAMIAMGHTDPSDVATLIDRHGGERLQMYKALQQTLGNAYVQKVIAYGKPDASGPLPGNTAPSADEVDGIPTGNAVHADDDTAIVSMNKRDSHFTGGLKDGAAHVGHSTTDTETTGDDKDTTKRTHDVSAGKQGTGYGVAYQQGRAHETEDHGVTVNNATTFGGSVGTAGISAKAGHEKEVGVDDNKRTHGVDGGVGISRDGDIEAEAGVTTKRDNAQGTTAFGATGGYKDGTATGTFTAKNSKNAGTDEAGNKKTIDNSMSASAHVGKDGVGADVAVATKGADGTASSASIGGQIGKDGWSGHAGYSVMSKSGTGANVSVGHGTKVTASAPEFVDGHWQVAYVRATTNSAAAGGSLGGGGFSVGVGGGAEQKEFESGIKRFGDFYAALNFYGHAAEELGEPVVDPSSLAGAMLIPVGETVGSGTSSAVSATGSVSFEGAKLGVGAKSSETHELDIKRVDAQHVQVTITTAGQDEKEISISGGLTDTKSKTTDTNKAITWQFDLLNPASQGAYKKFCKDHVAPLPGTAEWIRTERINSEQSKDDIVIAVPTGFDQNWTGTTSEDHVQDRAGTHDAYAGTNANDITVGWIGHLTGDKNAHSSATIESRIENGKDAGYTASMKFSGDSGDHNREAMNETFRMGDAKGTDAKASGDWMVSTDIDKSAIAEIEKSSRFKDAKTEEDKRRVLSAWIAEQGASGFSGLGSVSDKPVEWDVELKGDDNFPGRAGRVELDSKLAHYGDQLKAAPNDAAPTLASIEDTIKHLAQRYVAIDDRSKYTDLPGGLREKVLAQITHYLTAFKSLRSQAQIDVMQHHPETPAAATDPKLAALHQRLDAANAGILRDHAAVGVADRAVNKAKDHVITGHGDTTRGALASVHEYRAAALALNQRQMELDGPIEAARETYLHARDPQTAGVALLAPTEQKAQLLATMLIQLTEAARALKPVTTPNGVLGHEAFWATIPGEVGAAENEDDG